MDQDNVVELDKPVSDLADEQIRQRGAMSPMQIDWIADELLRTLPREADAVATTFALVGELRRRANRLRSRAI